MPLKLPATLEPFCDDDHDWHDAAAYALDLQRPADPAAAWDRHFDARPDWFGAFRDAARVVYVGSASDVLHRLEDHRDGDVRRATLLRVCQINELRLVWWVDDTEPEVVEYNLAAALRAEYPGWYVHQR